MKRIQYMLLAMFLIPMGSMLQLRAQSNSGFNPVNPGDPQLPVFKEYRPVTVSITPMSAGSVSRSGSSSKGDKFEVGTTVRIYRSSNANFNFKHWLKNGEVYAAAGTSTSFDYTVEDSGAEFVAVYEYSPSSPSDPTGMVRSKLFVQCEPAGACSFTLTNGLAYEMDTYVKLGVNPNQDYEFIGWYNGNDLVSNIADINYLMPYHDVTLTARFRYTWVFNPDNPEDPSSQGGNIQTEEHLKGDVNGDGSVNVSDVVELTNMILSNRTSTLNPSVCDANKDGNVNVTDAVEIINWILQGK